MNCIHGIEKPVAGNVADLHVMLGMPILGKVYALDQIERFSSSCAEALEWLQVTREEILDEFFYKTPMSRIPAPKP